MSKYKLLAISTKSDQKNLLQNGKMYHNIGVKIEEVRLGNKPLVHNISMTVYEDNAGEYIDFTNSMFKEAYGKIYLAEIGGMQNDI